MVSHDTRSNTFKKRLLCLSIKNAIFNTLVNQFLVFQKFSDNQSFQNRPTLTIEMITDVRSIAFCFVGVNPETMEIDQNKLVTSFFNGSCTLPI